VSAASVLLARKIGMREDRVASLRYAGMLHDIGKLGVPTRVLQKTGRLSAEELATIQMHPMRGLEMVREIEFLDEAFAGIMHHHERLDGLGYPMGLHGDQIPEFRPGDRRRRRVRLDDHDAVLPRRAHDRERLRELRRCAATQFDPAMVEALIARGRGERLADRGRPALPTPRTRRWRRPTTARNTSTTTTRPLSSRPAMRPEMSPA